MAETLIIHVIHYVFNTRYVKHQFRQHNLYGESV